MSSAGPAPLPHIGLLLEDEDAVCTLGAPAPLPHLSLVLYDAGFIATLSKSLDAATAAGTGTVTVGGTLNKTLASVSLSSVGTATSDQGSLDAPVYLPHMAFVLYGITGIVGALSKSLEDMSLTSQVEVPGNEIWPFEDEDRPARSPLYWPRTYSIDWFQTGTVLRDDTGGVVGVVGSNLNQLTLNGSGGVNVNATLAKTLETVAIASAGAVEVSGTLSKTLAPAVLSCAVSVNNDIVGTAAVRLDGMTVACTTDLEAGLTLSKTLQSLVSVSSGIVDVSGSVDRTLQGINANIDGSVLDGFVCVVNQWLDAMVCNARGNNGVIEVEGERPAGGWFRKKKKKYYEDLPTKEEVEEERIQLGILPKKVQKAVAKVIEKASGVKTTEQATNLAAAYFEEEQQRKLLEMLRNEIAAAKGKWQDEVFTVAHAMILDELQKRADRDELMKILEEREQEEDEINEVLELWMEL